MAGLFVTGTDTGVGKTVLTAALAAALRRAGVRVGAHKPALTGTDEPAGAWPPDHELLGAVTGTRPEEVAPLRFGPAVSPHLAARMAGVSVDPAALVDAARAAARRVDVLLVEGVGGLLVPLTDDCTVRDLARRLALPLIVAARPGLGTINHTLLTVEAARAAGLAVHAVVLTPWPEQPGDLERSNAETIARLAACEVACLQPIAGPDPDRLAAAGGRLPYRRWLDLDSGGAGGSP